MQILVACKFPARALDELRTLGTVVEYLPELSADDLPKAMRTAAILIVDRSRVSPTAITEAAALQMIVRTGTDVSNIAIEQASSGGIFVINCPDKDAVAVAELMMGMVLSLDRGLIENATMLRSGPSDQASSVPALGLAGRTMGIFGCGPVQRELARRARGFAMQVLAWVETPPETGDPEFVEFCNWPRELARRSDIVTVYAPPAEGEGLLVGAEFVENMRDGATLVYVGQPASMDEAALAKAARERGIRVGIDVYSSELTRRASKFRSSLLEVPGVIGTHHLADCTVQAQEATAAEAVRVIRRFLVAGEVLNCVNIAERSPATWQLLLRLRDAVGVMAGIMDAIRADGINAEEISSRVFTGAQAAWCTIALDERPSTDALNAIGSLEGVLHLELRAVV